MADKVATTLTLRRKRRKTVHRPRCMVDAIGNTLSRIVQREQARVRAMTQCEVAATFHFEWRPEASLERNLYFLFDALERYRRQCRAWEEAHHGTQCVVERVRDTYLLPRLREIVRNHLVPSNR